MESNDTNYSPSKIKSREKAKYVTRSVSLKKNALVKVFSKKRKRFYNEKRQINVIQKQSKEKIKEPKLNAKRIHVQELHKSKYFWENIKSDCFQSLLSSEQQDDNSFENASVFKLDDAEHLTNLNQEVDMLSNSYDDEIFDMNSNPFEDLFQNEEFLREDEDDSSQLDPRTVVDKENLQRRRSKRRHDRRHQIARTCRNLAKCHKCEHLYNSAVFPKFSKISSASARPKYIDNETKLRRGKIRHREISKNRMIEKHNKLRISKLKYRYDNLVNVSILTKRLGNRDPGVNGSSVLRNRNRINYPDKEDKRQNLPVQNEHVSSCVSNEHNISCDDEKQDMTELNEQEQGDASDFENQRKRKIIEKQILQFYNKCETEHIENDRKKNSKFGSLAQNTKDNCKTTNVKIRRRICRGQFRHEKLPLFKLGGTSTSLLKNKGSKKSAINATKEEGPSPSKINENAFTKEILTEEILKSIPGEKEIQKENKINTNSTTLPSDVPSKVEDKKKDTTRQKRKRHSSGVLEIKSQLKTIPIKRRSISSDRILSKNCTSSNDIKTESLPLLESDQTEEIQNESIRVEDKTNLETTSNKANGEKMVINEGIMNKEEKTNNSKSNIEDKLNDNKKSYNESNSMPIIFNEEIDKRHDKLEVKNKSKQILLSFKHEGASGEQNMTITITVPEDQTQEEPLVKFHDVTPGCEKGKIKCAEMGESDDDDKLIIDENLTTKGKRRMRKNSQSSKGVKSKDQSPAQHRPTQTNEPKKRGRPRKNATTIPAHVVSNEFALASYSIQENYKNLTDGNDRKSFEDEQGVSTQKSEEGSNGKIWRPHLNEIYRSNRAPAQNTDAVGSYNGHNSASDLDKLKLEILQRHLAEKFLWQYYNLLKRYSSTSDGKVGMSFDKNAEGEHLYQYAFPSYDCKSLGINPSKTEKKYGNLTQRNIGHFPNAAIPVKEKLLNRKPYTNIENIGSRCGNSFGSEAALAMEMIRSKFPASENSYSNVFTTESIQYNRFAPPSTSKIHYPAYLWSQPSPSMYTVYTVRPQDNVQQVEHLRVPQQFNGGIRRDDKQLQQRQQQQQEQQQQQQEQQQQHRECVIKNGKFDGINKNTSGGDEKMEGNPVLNLSKKGNVESSDSSKDFCVEQNKMDFIQIPQNCSLTAPQIFPKNTFKGVEMLQYVKFVDYPQKKINKADLFDTVIEHPIDYSNVKHQESWRPFEDNVLGSEKIRHVSKPTECSLTAVAPKIIHEKVNKNISHPRKHFIENIIRINSEAEEKTTPKMPPSPTSLSSINPEKKSPLQNIRSKVTNPGLTLSNKTFKMDYVQAQMQKPKELKFKIPNYYDVTQKISQLMPAIGSEQPTRVGVIRNHDYKTISNDGSRNIRNSSANKEIFGGNILPNGNENGLLAQNCTKVYNKIPSSRITAASKLNVLANMDGQYQKCSKNSGYFGISKLPQKSKLDEDSDLRNKGNPEHCQQRHPEITDAAVQQRVESGIINGVITEPHGKSSRLNNTGRIEQNSVMVNRGNWVRSEGSTISCKAKENLNSSLNTFGNASEFPRDILAVAMKESLNRTQLDSFKPKGNLNSLHGVHFKAKGSLDSSRNSFENDGKFFNSMYGDHSEVTENLKFLQVDHFKSKKNLNYILPNHSNAKSGLDCSQDSFENRSDRDLNDFNTNSKSKMMPKCSPKSSKSLDVFSSIVHTVTPSLDSSSKSFNNLSKSPVVVTATDTLRNDSLLGCSKDTIIKEHVKSDRVLSLPNQKSNISNQEGYWCHNFDENINSIEKFHPIIRATNDLNDRSLNAEITQSKWKNSKVPNNAFNKNRCDENIDFRSTNFPNLNSFDNQTSRRSTVITSQESKRLQSGVETKQISTVPSGHISKSTSPRTNELVLINDTEETTPKLIDVVPVHKDSPAALYYESTSSTSTNDREIRKQKFDELESHAKKIKIAHDEPRPHIEYISDEGEPNALVCNNRDHQNSFKPNLNRNFYPPSVHQPARSDVPYVNYLETKDEDKSRYPPIVDRSINQSSDELYPSFYSRRTSVDTASTSGSMDHFFSNEHLIESSSEHDDFDSIHQEVSKRLPQGKLCLVRQENILIRYFDATQMELFISNLHNRDDETSNVLRQIEIAEVDQQVPSDEGKFSNGRSEIIRLPPGVSFSAKETLNAEEYVAEMKMIKYGVPVDFKEYYQFVSRYQIRNRNNPVSLQTFLTMHNTNRLKGLFNSYVKYLEQKARERNLE